MTSEIPADFPRTLGGLVAYLGQRFGEHEAIAGETERWSYARLASEAERTATRLAGLGVRRGARVGLLAPNRPEWLGAAFGIARAGGTIVALNTLYRPHELAHAISSSGVRLIVAIRRFGKSDYEEILREVAGEARVVFLDRLADLESAAIGGDLPTATDPAAIFFTSGSTAKPKAVVLSHGGLTHNAYWLGEHIGIEPADRTWTALPLFFSGGFCLCAISTLSHGGTVVLNEVFEAGAGLARLEKEACTVMIGWNHGAQMIDHPSFDRSRLSLVKGVGGNLDLADRFLQPDHRAIGCYGMTETSTMCVAGRSTDPREVRRTFGRPMPGVTLRICDPESGKELATGEEGEIWVRSPAQMLGYDGMAREDCFDAEGFFHTGDLGFVDTDGCLHFTRRLKDVIKTMGVNVAAAEVEAALERHPAVSRAYVVGVPHPVRGENVAAFVVPAALGFDEQELLEHCRRELASYKVPRHVFVCAESEIPVSASQKVEKGKLRERAIATLAEASS